MNDKITEVIAQYDFTVNNTYKGRGSLMCQTDKGLKQIRPFEGSMGKLNNEYQLKERLFQVGFVYIDRNIMNKQGFLVTCDKYHVPYIVKDYFEGRECNIRNKDEIKMAVINLAKLHRTCNKIEINDINNEKLSPMYDVMFKHNKELKRVKNFIKTVTKKNQFELIFIENFEYFYSKALSVSDKLLKLESLVGKGKRGICHGCYNQHNVLISDKKIATVNFEHFFIDNQLIDLYQFLRKALEKNNYSVEILYIILEAYSSIISLEKEDYEYVYCLLEYPEKFWKISNRYFNNKKTWIPPKTVEKINDVIINEEEKHKLLMEYRQKYGVII